jgi:hypothetical protein
MKVRYRVVPSPIPGPIWQGIVEFVGSMAPCHPTWQQEHVVHEYAFRAELVAPDTPLCRGREGWYGVEETEMEPEELVGLLTDAAWYDEEEESEQLACWLLAALGYGKAGTGSTTG